VSHQKPPEGPETMASNPTQERQEAFLDALRKSQETVNHAIDTCFQVVQSAPPDLLWMQSPPDSSWLPDPQDVMASAYNFADHLSGSQRQFVGELPEAERGAAAPVTEPSPRPWAVDEAQVYTMRELNQRTAEVMREIEEHKAPAFITKHGRFVAMITPLQPGQVESRVLAEMARQLNKGSSQ
jgi:prevent-host-death family protein